MSLVLLKMISPRSKEAQYPASIHQQPNPYISSTSSQPIPNVISNQFQQIDTNYNNGHNNHYTTVSSFPPASNSSFSAPPVNQNYMYEQGSHLPQGPHPLQHVIAPQQGHYYPTSPFIPPNSTNSEYQYSFNAAYEHPSHSSSVPNFQQMNSSQSVPNLAVHGPLPSVNHDDAPFPGILEPQYHHEHFHSRSQTLPGESIKPKRSGSSNSSLLGMTPETARRNRCNICQKQFKRPSSLQTHLYSHTGEKPFVCDWGNCWRLFSVRSNMIRHKKLHERDDRLKKGADKYPLTVKKSDSIKIKKTRVSSPDI